MKRWSAAKRFLHGADLVCDLFFSQHDFQPGPDYFNIPHDGVIEVGFRVEI
jgi:hypothetical protein